MAAGDRAGCGERSTAAGHKGSRFRAERTDLDNHQLVVEALRAGLPAGSAGAVGGSLLLDEFVLTR